MDIRFNGVAGPSFTVPNSKTVPAPKAEVPAEAPVVYPNLDSSVTIAGPPPAAAPLDNDKTVPVAARPPAPVEDDKTVPVVAAPPSSATVPQKAPAALPLIDVLQFDQPFPPEMLGQAPFAAPKNQPEWYNRPLQMEAYAADPQHEPNAFPAIPNNAFAAQAVQDALKNVENKFPSIDWGHGELKHEKMLQIDPGKHDNIWARDYIQPKVFEDRAEKLPMPKAYQPQKFEDFMKDFQAQGAEKAPERVVGPQEAQALEIVKKMEEANAKHRAEMANLMGDFAEKMKGIMGEKGGAAAAARAMAAVNPAIGAGVGMIGMGAMAGMGAIGGMMGGVMAGGLGAAGLLGGYPRAGRDEPNAFFDPVAGQMNFFGGVGNHEVGHGLIDGGNLLNPEKFDFKFPRIDKEVKAEEAKPKLTGVRKMIDDALPPAEEKGQNAMQIALRAAVDKGVAADAAKAEALKALSKKLASAPQSEIKGICAKLEASLLDPNATVVSKKHLGGGINSTYIVTLSNGAKAVFKPTAGEDQRKLRNQCEEDHQGKREQAAYIVDKALGHIGRVPPTVRRTLIDENGKEEEGALLYFIPEAKTASVSYQEKAAILKNSPDNSSYHRMAVLDNVIGNLDRHGGNWMVTKDGDALPIDHGLAFPFKNEKQKFHNFDFEGKVDLNESDKAALKGFLGQEEQLRADLSPLLQTSSIDSVFERVNRMVGEGNTSNWWREA